MWSRALIVALLPFNPASAAAAIAAAPEPPQPSPCEIANRTAAAVDASTLPAAIKNPMTAYRKAWRAFCVGSPGHPSLDSLFGDAIVIFDLTNSKEVDTKAMEPILDYENRQMPAMGPGMDFLLYPYEDEFAQTAVTRGTAMDRFFWKRFPLVGTVLGKPPWMRPTHDFGGCTRHGEYDWIAAFQTLAELRAADLGPTYRRVSAEAERDTWEVLERDGGRPCGEIAPVLADLERVIRWVRSQPSLQGHLEPLAEKVQRIKEAEAR